MKVQDKYISLFFIFTMTLGCVNKDFQEDVVVQKMTNIESVFPISESIWGISDGIKVIKGDTTESFIFDIESPPDIVRKNAEIRFIYRLVSSDSLIDEKITTYSMDSVCPLYWINTLNVFKSNNQYGAYFYTSLTNYPIGLDPIRIVLWVYYNEKLHQIEGVIPQHEDWAWEDYYYVTFNMELEKDFPDVHNQMSTIWNNQMEKYRKKVYGN